MKSLILCLLLSTVGTIGSASAEVSEHSELSVKTDKWNDSEKAMSFKIHGKEALVRSPLEQEFIEKKMRFASWETKKHVKTMTRFR